MRAGSSQWTLNSLGILLLGAAWIWASAVPAGSQNGRLPAPQAGFQAPDFRLPTPSGETISLADLRGQPVLINLWASWCPPCREEMPAIQRVYQDYQSRGFVVLAVNATSQDSLPSALEFVSDLGLTFPILLDSDSVVSEDLYQVLGLPTSVLIGRDGTVRAIRIGILDLQELEGTLQAFLAESP